VGGASFLIFCAVDAFITLVSVAEAFSLRVSNPLGPHDAVINARAWLRIDAYGFCLEEWDLGACKLSISSMYY
jgi:hypothetical protein